MACARRFARRIASHHWRAARASAAAAGPQEMAAETLLPCWLAKARCCKKVTILRRWSRGSWGGAEEGMAEEESVFQKEASSPSWWLVGTLTGWLTSGVARDHPVSDGLVDCAAVSVRRKSSDGGSYPSCLLVVWIACWC